MVSSSLFIEIDLLLFGVGVFGNTLLLLYLLFHFFDIRRHFRYL